MPGDEQHESFKKKKKKECQSLCRKSSMATPLKQWLSKLSVLYRDHLLGSGDNADLESDQTKLSS